MMVGTVQFLLLMITTQELLTGALSSGDYSSIDVDVTGEVALCDYESCLGCTDDTAL